MKEIYQVPFSYRKSGKIEVSAGSEAEAIEKVQEIIESMLERDLDNATEFDNDSVEIDSSGIDIDYPDYYEDDYRERSA